MKFNETFEDHLGAVENYLMDIHSVAVDYDPLGLDEYWIDDGVITINDTRSQQEQLFVLLHEAGHVMLRSRKDFEEMCPNARNSKIEVLKEEILAWEEARKLAVLLSIELDEDWHRHVRQAITKYVRWAQI
tara:strand:- start:203 stop:595 length:393 start_codon:yes stop_codon:yes gene_type:complete